VLDAGKDAEASSQVTGKSKKTKCSEKKKLSKKKYIYTQVTGLDLKQSVYFKHIGKVFVDTEVGIYFRITEDLWTLNDLSRTICFRYIDNAIDNANVLSGDYHHTPCHEIIRTDIYKFKNKIRRT
jgi:hypothetical protein